MSSSLTTATTAATETSIHDSIPPPSSPSSPLQSSPSSPSQSPSLPPPPSSAASPNEPPLKVLFLSSDTGGGHRASATALGDQFQRLYPNSTYHLLDITKDCSRAPYNNLQSWYSHLSSNPNQWNLIYKVSNNKVFESVFKIHFQMSTKESKIRDVIREYEADVVISVHPLMNDIPVQSCMKISNETNRHLPFFTVVTDLGSGHCAWFDKSVEKMFIASNAIERLAKERGNVPNDKLVMSGLPIRYEFAFEAERLGDRTSMEGKIYQLQMRGYLNLLDGNCGDSDDIGDTHSNNHYNNSTDSSTNRMNINKNNYCCNSNNSHDHDRKVLLVMGGGEGVGWLSNIVNKLYVQCSLSNIRAMILVVCGRNETLKESLKTRDWDSFLEDEIEALQHQQEQKQSKGKIISQTQYQEGKQQQQQQQENLNSKLPKQQQQQSSDNQSIARKVTGIVINPLRVLSRSTLSKILPKEKNHHKTDDNIKPIIIEEEKKERCEIPTASSRSSSLSSTTSTKSSLPPPPSQIIVKPLGFVTNMAEYMVAADILVTKAGPGTIAEAASLGLPVLLTSFLPGQEEGNVDFVVEKKFGEYQSDSNPEKVAHTACQWLRSPDRMNEMSIHAKKAGMPNAAEDIVKCIGKSVLRWKELHEDVISGGEDI